MSIVKIGLGADVHVQQWDATETAFNKVRDDMINNSLVDYYFVAGDAVGWYFSLYDWYKSKWDELRNAGIDINLVCGNHEWQPSDVYNFAIEEKIRAKLKAMIFNNTSINKFSYSKIIGNTAFICLSMEGQTELYGDYGCRFSQQTLNWFKNEVAKHQNKNIIVLSHHPNRYSGLWLPDLTTYPSYVLDVESSNAIKEILQIYRVDAWFTGHVHVHPLDNKTQHSTPDGFGGCTFVHIPSTGAKTNEDWWESTYYPFWRYFELQDGSEQITVKVRNSESQAFETSVDFNINLTYPFSTSEPETIELSIDNAISKIELYDPPVSDVKIDAISNEKYLGISSDANSRIRIKLADGTHGINTQ